MASPTSKSSFPGFQNEEDNILKALGKLKPAPKKPGSSSTKGRPYSASRALKSANHFYGVSATAQKVPGAERNTQNESPHTLYSNLSREELVGALYEAKKCVKVLESSIATLRGEGQRWENEVGKQQRRIEKLLESSGATGGNKSGLILLPPSAEVRRELEKSLLVRQLKTQMMLLRNAVAEREIEIETLKKNQKGTKLVELSNEKEEFYLETLRLKQVVRELRDSLQSERQRRVWDKKRNGAGEEIKKEVARLTSGYQNILKEFSPTAGERTPSVRPASASSTPSNNQLPPSKRPQSASKGRTPSPLVVNASNATTLQHSANASGSSLMPSPNTESKVHHPIKLSNRSPSASRRERGLNDVDSSYKSRIGNITEAPDELDFFSGIADNHTNQPFSVDDDDGIGFDDIIQSNSSQPNIKVTETERKDSKILTTETVRVFVTRIQTSGLINVERKAGDANDVFLLLSFGDLWDTNTSTVWEGGSDVSWNFSQTDEKYSDMLWHASLSSLQSDMLAITAMDENEISVSRQIGVGKARMFLPPSFSTSKAILGSTADVMVKVTLIDELGKPAGTISLTLILTSISEKEALDSKTSQLSYARETDAPSIEQTLKFQEKEKVEGQYKGGASWYGATVKGVNKDDNTYHLLYDDGDEEADMQEEKIRTKETDVRSQKTDIVEKVADDTEKEKKIPKEQKIEKEQKMQKLEQTITPKEVEYNVGDEVEALFEKGDEWYKATVKKMTDGGKYNLLYEDGDEEDDISVGRMRAINIQKSENRIAEGSILIASISSNKEADIVDEVSEQDVLKVSKISPRMSFEVDAEISSSRNSTTISPRLIQSTSLKSADPSPLKTSLSMKSSDDAFLDNYLDDLSDDEDQVVGALTSEKAVYGNVPLKENKESGNENLNSDNAYGSGIEEKRRKSISKEFVEEDDDGGGYEEDFDA